MQKTEFDVLLLTKPSNMFYLTGDGRLCAYAMITKQGQVALGVPTTDVDDVTALAHFDHIISFEDEVGMIHAIADHFKRFGIQKGTVGLEFTFLTQSMMKMVTHPHAKPEKVEIGDCTPILSGLRLVKDSEELDLLRESAKIADIGMEAAVKAVKLDLTESQIAAAAEYAMRHAGAEGFWRTYVSSGPRTNIAHGLPTNRSVQKGDLVTIDIHPIVNGYSSDICRTVCVGDPSTEQENAYQDYLQAQQATIAEIKAGVDIAALEKTFHDQLKAAGHGAHIFGPPIHGVGIDFEEAPLPPGHAFFHGEKEAPPLPQNVVIAVGNCGVYLGVWGVRVEDTNIIQKERPETLTHYPRQLLS
ncbi:MAG: Xaa-Pro peptidase family protein [Brevefilum sp.]|nr:Xaa-Pro peptidase family protein [Brevefilum sp.]